LKNPPRRGIRSSVLMVLAVLSLRLSPFAHGQQSAISFTNPATAETVVLPKSVPDPLEPFNRAMWNFNVGLMTDVIKPTSRVYRFVVRKPIRTGIGNFGRNLTYPGRLINNLAICLQYHRRGGRVLGRGDQVGHFEIGRGFWPDVWQMGLETGFLFDAARFWTEQ
jgi:hypothetical protein